MEIERFLEKAKRLGKKKKGKEEELERFKKIFERFHNINRNYMDKETFEKTQVSLSSMAEVMKNTIQYLDSEITRLRNKGRKQPFESVELAEMQKVQKRNELLIKEFIEREPIQSKSPS